MLRRVLLTAVCCGLAAPASALAVAGPMMPLQGGSGVTMPGLGDSYLAVRSGHDTEIDRMQRDHWSIQAKIVLRGHLGVPAVGMDGSTTGLSADGRTLVVAGLPRKAATRLVVLDTHPLRVRHEIRLPGYFTVDAVSPDGTRVFLVKYRSVDPGDLRYEVRAYDLAAGRMLPEPIVDPREPDEKMQGWAVTRLMSPDGRWAYTLYTGEENFVHALDTRGAVAYCVDLPAVPQDVADANLKLDGPLLRVASFATIDTRTWKVERGNTAGTPIAAKRTPAAPASQSDGGALLWMLVLVPIAAGAGFATRRR
jgi:hypothetical protein